MSGAGGGPVQITLHQGRRTEVLRAHAPDLGASVVVKRPVRPTASAEERERYRHEFAVASRIVDDNVVRYLRLQADDERIALIQEDFEARSLAACIPAGGMAPPQWLAIAVQLARGLAAIHARGVIHCALHPGNILVNECTGVAKIADFAMAAQVRHDVSPLTKLDRLGIPLAYVSPEQTGRMNRTVDWRTDLYSLGAMLYHMACGEPPFAAADPLALVHCHLARMPVPVHERNPQVPRAIAHIIARLLAKDAEDRYQTAVGLLHDLSHCAHAVQADGTIAEFELGSADRPARLQLPQRLYGRDEERRRLLDAFAAAAAGQKGLLLVAGYAGVGKSALVHEVHRAIAEKSGCFAAGKFEPLERDAPYGALTQALRSLVAQALAQSDERLAACRASLLRRVPRNLGVLSALVPELERIVGPQPAVEEVGPLESRHRFLGVLREFTTAFARAEHPLVLFLDDLQWADAATLECMQTLATGAEPQHLLLIGAYRDNEVEAHHPLLPALAAIERDGGAVATLRLASLHERHVVRLLADALHTEAAEVRELAAIVCKKTDGNPFFVEALLRELQQAGLLVFRPEQRAWTWDAARIAGPEISPNVADLLSRRLSSLPPNTRRALFYGACIGSRFSLSALARLLNAPKPGPRPARPRGSQAKWRSHICSRASVRSTRCARWPPRCARS